MKKMNRLCAVAAAFGLAAPAAAWASPHVERLPTPLSGVRMSPAVSSDSTTPDGRVIVAVRLRTDPLLGIASRVGSEQEGFLSRCLHLPGVEVVARTRHVLNAVFLAVDPRHLASIEADPAVSRVSAVADYRVDLSETVPYVGAAAVQAKGIDGSGVRVAVFDSGIDYLHEAFGGAGDPAEFAANDPAVIEPGTFPTARVVGGVDFVGSVWPDGPLAPDPDPLDDGPARGHGTHVADIIGGDQGVAPGVELHAVKVCSSIGGSCSGVALIQGMEYAVDPNGDGDTSDHLDIINMSLSARYGQPFDDDLAAAVDNASALGVLTVASASNTGDRPFSTGTPAAATSALSVAQTAVPSAIQDQMEVTAPAADAGLYVAVRQSWSAPLDAVAAGPVQYADGAGSNLNGCAPFGPGSLDGQIVMVDRGGCAFSDKIRNIEEAGGRVGIIGLIAAGDPFAGSFGGGSPISILGFMIDQATADILRTGAAAVSFDPANGVPLAGSVVSSTARGPRNGDNGLKPEIGAPGASISAAAGTGVGTETFGGTSGASPMVAGAAALLLEARPALLPWETKAMLMNFARPPVAQDFTGTLAPITRIGAGELDVAESFLSRTLIYTVPAREAKISLGYEPVARGRRTYRVRVRVRNDSDQRRRIKVTHDFRNRADADTAAVGLRHRDFITVGPNSVRDMTVRFIVRGDNLPESSMTSGVEGNVPENLTATEYDGLLMFEDEVDFVSIPWHIIPRKSADVRANPNLRFRGDEARVRLRNRGVGPAQNNTYSLLAVSPNLPEGVPGAESPTPDIKAVGVRTSTVPAEVCGPEASFVVQFAFHSWEPQSHLLPVSFFANIDFDGDGDTEYRVFNEDFDVLSGTQDGRNVSLVEDVDAGTVGATFFAEHATNTKNTVVTVCAEQLGLTLADYGLQPADITFGAQDAYFAGPGDELPPLRLMLGAERYAATVDDVPPRSRGIMTVVDRGTGPDLGILLFTNGDRGEGRRGGATPDSEGLIFFAPGAAVPADFL